MILAGVSLSNSGVDIAALSQSVQQKDNSINFLTYENPSVGVIIQYPTDWQVDEGELFDDSVVKFTSSSQSSTDDFREYLEIDVSPAGLETVEGLANQSINLLRYMLTNYNLVQSDSTTIANTNGYKVIYTYSEGQFEYKVMQDWVIKDDKSFRFTYVSEVPQFPDYLPIVERMIDSFKVAIR